MTLIEIIISIAIFALLGVVLILVGTHIDNTTKATTNLKNKIVEQSPYAANHVQSFRDSSGNVRELSTEELNIRVSVQENGTYYVTEPDPTNPAATVVVQKSYNNPEVEMKADKYKTEDIIYDGMTDEEIEAYERRPNGGLNLEFVEIQPTTAPPSTT